MDKKLCNKCEIEKKLIFFNKDKSKKDGYRNSCKDCQKNYSRDFYIKNKESICNHSNDYYKLNHYTNLQPLCSFVNRVIKRDKIIYG
jgi:hypothetical protein